MTGTQSHAVITRQPHLATLVAERIVTLIEERDLAPGEAIPAEAELARSFGVNRLAVREAIRILAAREILEASQGKPARVRMPSGDVIGQLIRFRLRRQSLSIEDLLDARRAIEGQLTRRAAGRVSTGRASTKRAEAALNALAEATDDRDRFAALDVAFHVELATMAGNDLLFLMLESLTSVMLDARRSSYTGAELRGDAQAKALAAHRQILDAIGAGNGDAAVTEMDAHLAAIEHDLRAGGWSLA